MLLYLSVTNTSTPRFSLSFWLILLIFLACARAGLSSPLSIEAGVDDTFFTLESAQFHTHAVYAHARIQAFYDTVSRTCASGRAYCAHPVETHTHTQQATLLTHHFLPLFVANHINHFIYAFGH